MEARSITMDELINTGAVIMSDGYRTNRSELGHPGFRIIRVADVQNGLISFDGADFVSEKFAAAIGSKIGRPGDILLTTKGTVGRVAVLPEIDNPVVYSPQLCFFRVVSEVQITRRFLRLWLSSPEFKEQASHRMNNTDMAPYINLLDIRSLRLALPPVEDQLAIGDVLGVLDDKISANHRENSTLTSIRDALLPSLMSGKLRVKNVERVAEEVL